MSEYITGIAMRPQVVPFMNTGTAEAPIWTQCGKGWKKFSENPNAQTEAVQYINMASETTDTVSYAPQYSFECDLMYTESTIKKIYDVAKDRKIGSEAVLDFVIVDMFDESKTTPGSYTAHREALAVAVTSLDGTKKMTMSGNLNGQGDGVKGLFDKETSTFTADTAATTATDSEG